TLYCVSCIFKHFLVALSICFCLPPQQTSQMDIATKFRKKNDATAMPTIVTTGSLIVGLATSSCAVVYLDIPVVVGASSVITNCAPFFQASPLNSYFKIALTGSSYTVRFFTV